MRGILIVNPNATSMSRTVCELTVRSLAGLVDVRVEQTKYRGHARELAAAAHGELVIVLGGDGSINEVVNGVMSWDGGQAEGRDGAKGSNGVKGSEPPLIAVIPGGGGNVFAQALGLPADAAAAIRRVREVIAAQSYRTIGLGLAGDRYLLSAPALAWTPKWFAKWTGCAPRDAAKARRCSCGQWSVTISAAPTGASRR